MSRQNLDLFRAGLAAWNEGDDEAIIDMCHPEVEWALLEAVG